MLVQPVAPLVTVVVPTRDRGPQLARMLSALKVAVVDFGDPTEILVVDDRSADVDVHAIVAAVGEPFECVSNVGQGASAARNTGIRRAAGQYIAFLDDDVIVSESWLRAMIEPLRRDAFGVTAGVVRIAPHLERPWMTAGHRVMFAETDFEREGLQAVVSANLAARADICRSLLFDEDLGPGKLGLFDDTLFYMRANELHRVCYAGPESLVVHHFDDSRLARDPLLAHGRKGGASEAFASYHWQQSNHSVPRLRLLKAMAELWLYRLRHAPLPKDHASEREVWLVSRVAYHDQYRKIRGRRRKYSDGGGSADDARITPSTLSGQLR